MGKTETRNAWLFSDKSQTSSDVPQSGTSEQSCLLPDLSKIKTYISHTLHGSEALLTQVRKQQK